MWFMHCPWCEMYLGVELTEEQGDDDKMLSDTLAPKCPDCGQQQELVNCFFMKQIGRTESDPRYKDNPIQVFEVKSA